MAARIVCQHPLGDGYVQTHATVGDCQHIIARIESEGRGRHQGGCEGPHIIEEWRDGAWRPADQ